MDGGTVATSSSGLNSISATVTNAEQGLTWANGCIPLGVQSAERGFARHGLAHAFLDCLLILELVELHTLRRDLLLLTDSRDALSLKCAPNVLA